MSFAAPGLLPLLIAAPAAFLAVAALLLRRSRAEAGWAGRSMLRRLRAGGRPRPPWAVATIAALSVLGLTTALARPRWGPATHGVERRGVDVVVVLDTSLSMAARDVEPSRLGLARSLVGRLVRALPEERFGLVAAEGVGVVLSPLTVDGAVLDLVLESAEPGSLPISGTRLAPALESALGLFPEQDEAHRVLVVVGDGEIHGESIEASLEAIRGAGVVVHAIGVGTVEGAEIPLPGPGAAHKRRPDGTIVVTRLERDPLEALARATGGAYLDASGASADPAPIAARIAAMEGRRLEADEVSTLEDRFQWPLGAAAAALAVGLVWGAYPPRRREGRA